MLTGLVDHRRGKQPRSIEVADGETLEPRFLPARIAVELCGPDVPQLDVNAVGAALAKQEHRHKNEFIRRANKKQNNRKRP